MRKYAYGAGLIVTLAMPLLFVHFRAFGQEAKPTDPIFGTWVMDMSKSYSKRLDEKPTFTTQHMRILAPEGDGVPKHSLSTTPTSRPNYSYTANSMVRISGSTRSDNDQKRTLTHWHHLALCDHAAGDHEMAKPLNGRSIPLQPMAKRLRPSVGFQIIPNW